MVKRKGIKFMETCWIEPEYRHPAMMSAKETVKRLNKRHDGRQYYYKQSETGKCFNIYATKLYSTE